MHAWDALCSAMRVLEAFMAGVHLAATKEPTEPWKTKQACRSSFLSLMTDFGCQFCYKTEYLSSNKLNRSFEEMIKLHQKEKFIWKIQNYQIFVFHFVVFTPVSLVENRGGLFIYLVKHSEDSQRHMGNWSTSAGCSSFQKVQFLSPIINHLHEYWHFLYLHFFEIRCWAHRILFI